MISIGWLFFAGIHVKAFGFYRMLARRFPFSIYYRIIGDVVVVAAVLDNRRRVQLGDLLESIGRKARLTDDEAALFERDKSPVRDVSFD